MTKLIGTIKDNSNKLPPVTMVSVDDIWLENKIKLSLATLLPEEKDIFTFPGAKAICLHAGFYYQEEKKIGEIQWCVIIPTSKKVKRSCIAYIRDIPDKGTIVTSLPENKCYIEAIGDILKEYGYSYRFTKTAEIYASL